MNYADIPPLGVLAISFLFYVVIYIFFSGLNYWLAWHLNSDRWQHRKSQHQPLRKGQIRREFWLSIRSIGLFSLLSTTSWYFTLHGQTQMYFSIAEYGGWWFVISYVLFVSFHDAWFYWTHRWMHHQSVFSWVHAEHHRSTHPTPWACYSFSLPEAFIQGLYFFLMIFIIPIHPLAFALVLINQQIFNTQGHAGYEYLPRGWVESRIGKFYNTATHHNMHHRFFKGNYGLYTNLWDGLMKTNQEGYRVEVLRITEKPLLGYDATQHERELGHY